MYSIVATHDSRVPEDGNRFRPPDGNGTDGERKDHYYRRGIVLGIAWLFLRGRPWVKTALHKVHVRRISGMMDSEYLVASSTTVRSYEKNALAFFKFPMFIVPSVNINGFAEAVNLTDARGNPVK